MESKSRMRGRKLDDDDDDDDDGSSWDEARTSAVAIARGCRGVGRIISARVVPTENNDDECECECERCQQEYDGRRDEGGGLQGAGVAWHGAPHERRPHEEGPDEDEERSHRLEAQARAGQEGAEALGQGGIQGEEGHL